MKAFSVQWGNSVKPKVRFQDFSHFAQKDDTTLILEGFAYGIKGRESFPPDFPQTRIAEILLEFYLEGTTDFFKSLTGQGSVTIVTKNQLECFRFPLSTTQIYYSSNVLSNRLLPVYIAEGRPNLSYSYFLNYMGEQESLRYESPETPFDSISRLKPGELLVVKDQKLSVIQLIANENFIYPYKPEQKVEEVAFKARRLLESAVEFRLGPKDRPVTCQLSGGLDSSFVTALVALKVPKVSAYLVSNSKSPSHSFSENCAKQVAHHLGVPLTIVDSKDLPRADLNAQRPYSDEPSGFFWQGQLFSPLNEQFVSNNGDLFTGFGADQLFLRDPRILVWLLKEGKIATLNKMVRSCAKNLDRSPVHLLWQTALLTLPSQWYENTFKIFEKLRFNPFATEEVSTPSELLGTELWLKTQVNKTKKRSVATLTKGRSNLGFSYLTEFRFNFDPYFENRGCESRHPFCDSRLIEFMLKDVSWNLVHDWENPYKHILREAQKDLVPEEVRNRKKNEFIFDGFLALFIRDNKVLLQELLSQLSLPLPVTFVKEELLKGLEQLSFGVRSYSTKKILILLGYLVWWRDFMNLEKNLSVREVLSEELPALSESAHTHSEYYQW